MNVPKSKEGNLRELKENEIDSVVGGLNDKEMKEFYPDSTKENDPFYRLHKWEESAGTCKKCGKRYTYCNQGIETGIGNIFSRRDYCAECRSALNKNPSLILKEKM